MEVFNKKNQYLGSICSFFMIVLRLFCCFSW